MQCTDFDWNWFGGAYLGEMVSNLTPYAYPENISAVKYSTGNSLQLERSNQLSSTVAMVQYVGFLLAYTFFFLRFFELGKSPSTALRLNNIYKIINYF